MDPKPKKKKRRIADVGNRPSNPSKNKPSRLAKFESSASKVYDTINKASKNKKFSYPGYKDQKARKSL